MDSDPEEELALFERLVQFSLDAHHRAAKTPENRFRRFDGRTPFAVHPLWCATMIMQEPLLPAPIRSRGWKALLLHDVQEDTDAVFPRLVTDEVRADIADMLFASREAEMREIWARSRLTRLLKVYDKTCNYLALLGGRNREYDAYVLRLLGQVVAEWGDQLNVVRMAYVLVQG